MCTPFERALGRTRTRTCSSAPFRNVWCCAASITMRTTVRMTRIRFTPRTPPSASTALYVDGRQIPSKPFQPNFEDDLFVKNYMNLFSSTGKMWQDEGNGLSRSDFLHGYTFFGFDQTPDQCDGPCFHLVQ